MRRLLLVAGAATALALPLLVAVPVTGVPATAPPAGRPAPKPVSPELTDVALGSTTRPAAGTKVTTKATTKAEEGAPARELVVSRPSTEPFSAVGVTWAADPAVRHVRVALRHRLGGGAWSPWTTVDQSDIGLDPGDESARRGTRGGTDPVWTGRSDGVEARVSATSGAAPRDVRLTLIDPRESAADAAPTADASLPPAGAPSSTGDLRATTLAASRPAIYSRAQWGADPDLMGWDPEYAPSLRAGFLHHTVDSNAYSAADVPRILRSIYAYHSRTRGWGDIGYNFLVDRFGRIWEGRYGGIESTVIGAHTGGFNYGTFGVSMLGTYSTTPVPAATERAVARIFAWKLARWYLNPYGQVALRSGGGGTSRYAAGTVVTKNVISGHRDVGQTTCPGNAGYARLPAIRRAVASLMGTGLLAPSVSPRTVTYGGGTGPRLRAGLFRSSSWAVTVTELCTGRVVSRRTGSGTRIDVTWNLRGATGAAARPGGYRMTATASAGDLTARPYSADVVVAPPAGAPATPSGAAAPAGPAGLVPVPPARVLDTRTGTGGRRLPLGAGNRVDVPVLGVGRIPRSGVAAVLVTVSTSCSTAGNWVKVWPAGSPRPTGSVAAAGPATARSVVRVGAGGRISVAADRSAADVIVDVTGYLPTAGGLSFHQLDARRLVGASATPLAPGETRVVNVRGLARGAVPASATAVALNVGVSRPTGRGTLRIYPAGSPAYSTTAMTYVAGSGQLQRAVTALSGGQVRVQNAGRTPARLILDLNGWYAPASTAGGRRFTAVPRSRVFDARLGAGRTTAVRLAGRAGVPSGVRSVVVQLAVAPSRLTGVTVWRSGAPRPATEDLPASPGRWWTNLALVPVAADGTAQVFHRAGTSRVVVDVVGYHR